MPILRAASCSFSPLLNQLSPSRRDCPVAVPWFRMKSVAFFDDDYLRTLPFLTPRQTEREAQFVAESLQIPTGGALLDLACGYGRHAMELAAKNYKVTGLDLSVPLDLTPQPMFRLTGGGFGCDVSGSSETSAGVLLLAALALVVARLKRKRI